MPHEITVTDRQEGIADAWHHLTKVMPGWLTMKAREILGACWLSQWEVVKSPLFTLDAAGKPIATEYVQLVSSDNPAIQIGAPVHGQTYQPITNRSFMDTIAEALDGIRGAQIASVGSVCGRGRVFVSVKLEELAEFRAAGRTFNPYLTFLNSHDQSAPFGVMASNTCTVCNNTFGMNLRLIEGQRSGMRAAGEASARAGAVRIRLKHTKNVAMRLDNVPEVVDGFLGAQAEFRAVMETLESQEIDSRNVKPLMTGFLMAPELGRADLSTVKKEALELSTRRANQIERLTELHFSGAGNKGRTLADAFSAVTDYYTHESASGDNMARQLVSSEFGDGAKQKDRAFRAFQEGDEIARMLAVGNAVLAVN